MLFKVLKSFPYAHDHKETHPQAEGDLIPVHPSVVDGLTDEGFIREATAEEIAEANGDVEAPAPRRRAAKAD